MKQKTQKEHNGQRECRKNLKQLGLRESNPRPQVSVLEHATPAPPALPKKDLGSSAGLVHPASKHPLLFTDVT